MSQYIAQSFPLFIGRYHLERESHLKRNSLPSKQRTLSCQCGEIKIYPRGYAQIKDKVVGCLKCLYLDPSYKDGVFVQCQYFNQDTKTYEAVLQIMRCGERSKPVHLCKLSTLNRKTFESQFNIHWSPINPIILENLNINSAEKVQRNIMLEWVFYEVIKNKVNQKKSLRTGVFGSDGFIWVALLNRHMQTKNAYVSLILLDLPFKYKHTHRLRSANIIFHFNNKCEQKNVSLEQELRVDCTLGPLNEIQTSIPWCIVVEINYTNTLPQFISVLATRKLTSPSRTSNSSNCVLTTRETNMAECDSSNALNDLLINDQYCSSVSSTSSEQSTPQIEGGNGATMSSHNLSHQLPHQSSQVQPTSTLNEKFKQDSEKISLTESINFRQLVSCSKLSMFAEFQSDLYHQPGATNSSEGQAAFSETTPVLKDEKLSDETEAIANTEIEPDAICQPNVDTVDIIDTVNTDSVTIEKQPQEQNTSQKVISCELGTSELPTTSSDNEETAISLPTTLEISVCQASSTAKLISFLAVNPFLENNASISLIMFHWDLQYKQLCRYNVDIPYPNADLIGQQLESVHVFENDFNATQSHILLLLEFRGPVKQRYLMEQTLTLISAAAPGQASVLAVPGPCMVLDDKVMDVCYEVGLRSSVWLVCHFKASLTRVPVPWQDAKCKQCINVSHVVNRPIRVRASRTTLALLDMHNTQLVVMYKADGADQSSKCCLQVLFKIPLLKRWAEICPFALAHEDLVTYMEDGSVSRWHINQKKRYLTCIN